MEPGDTVWIEPTAIGAHLWIVLSNPFEHEELGRSVLAASVTTLRGSPREDRSCLLSAADHPDLTHDSWVCYDYARYWGLSYLAKWCSPAAPLSMAVLRRVLDGAQATDRIKLEYAELLDEQGLFDPPEDE